MAGTDGNCSNDIPTSDVYFSEISDGDKVGVLVSSATCVAVIGLYLDQLRFVLRKYQTGSHPDLKAKSLWLLGIYPVFSIMALLAVFVPRVALLCDLASSVYLAVCLYHFTTLIIVYTGGIPALLYEVENCTEGFILRTPPFCCCCVCCPIVRPTWSNLRKIRLMVFQYAVIQPFISFLTLVLWMDEKYVRGQMGADKPYLYLAIARVVSTGAAVYGLLILFWSSQGFLKTHHLRLKLFVIQMVIFLHNFQEFVFLTLAKNNVPPCSGRLSSSVRSDAVRHMVVVGEMLLLALLARVLYRRPHASPHSRLGTASADDLSSSATVENKAGTNELRSATI